MASLSRLRKMSKLPFPLGRPNWPNELPHSPANSKLGANFKTSWSRRHSARLVRSLITDFVTRPAIKVLACPEVTGLDRIAHITTPVIFAANHASHLDTPLLLANLPERFRHKTAVGAGADYFYDKAWKAYTWTFLLAAIPIERNKVSRRSNDLALSVLTDGWSLILFPEGGRTPDGFAREFKGGVAHLATRTNTPVVPVYLGGTFEIYGKGAASFHRGPTVVNFGQPLSPENKDARSFVKEIEAAVTQLANEVHGNYWTALQRANSKDATVQETRQKDGWIAQWERPKVADAKDGEKKSWPRLPIIDRTL